MPKSLTLEEVNKRAKENFLENVEIVNYLGERSLATLHCLDCDYTWTSKGKNVINNAPHRCPSCKLQKEKIGKTVKCAFCNKIIYRKNSRINKNKSNYFYCSRKCGNQHKNLLRKINGDWNNSSNYRNRAFENYEHRCLVCGWNEDERILEVHHIDENHNNNDINNLCILCPICHRKITLGYYTLNGTKLIPIIS